MPFLIDQYSQVFDSSSLARSRQRLFFSYARYGRGLEDVLAFWAKEHPDLVEQAERDLREEHPKLEPFALQLWSVAWHAWAPVKPGEADDYTTRHMEVVWNKLDATQHSTFLAITHALHAIGLIDELERIVHIKGKTSGSGTNQFRVFGNLRLTALNRLREVLDKPRRSIHPGYPVSFRERRKDNDVRKARLQICTRELMQFDEFGRPDRAWEATDRGCDIDIDYRQIKEAGHLSPSNSDVTCQDDNIDHFARHQQAFGGPVPGLLLT
jgi:hypothetical protein